MSTDVSDLDIKILFKELWENAIVASFYYINPEFERQIPEYTEPKNYTTGFWYHCGRPIKTEFKNLHDVNYTEYDISNGEGKFMEIVTRLRNSEQNFQPSNSCSRYDC